MGNREIFERMASVYDTDERVAITEMIVKEIRMNLSDTKGKKAIDYGCGTGLIGFGLIDLFDSMLFIDEASNMIAEVERKIEQTGTENADVLCSDLSVDPMNGVNADTIIVCQTLLHVPDVHTLLVRLHGMLNEHGNLIIVDFDKNERVRSDMVHNGFDQSKLSTMLKEIGFTSVNSHTFHHGSNMFMGQDASLFMMEGRK